MKEKRPTAASADAPRPVRIEIPSISVTAPTIPLGLSAERTLEVPEDYWITGWWEGGPEPGERGAAVIVGHVDSKSGPAVFYRLDELATGELIKVVRHDGSSVRFAVERVEQHPKDDFPTDKVYRETKGPSLRLITCGGQFDSSTGHYVDNVIVFTRHVRG